MARKIVRAKFVKTVPMAKKVMTLNAIIGSLKQETSKKEHKARLEKRATVKASLMKSLGFAWGDWARVRDEAKAILAK